MCFKTDGRNIIVASEKVEEGDWISLRNNNLLVRWVEDNRIEYEV